MRPKDWIIYIDKDSGKTEAVLDTYEGMDVFMANEGHTIIGYVSNDPRHKQAVIDYGDQVLRG